jgi:flagellum-specific peptidoglycan hydrolase FlgJ
MKKLILLLSLSITALFVKAQSIQDYVEEYAPIAKELSEKHEIPASLILGIAIHESAAGKSRIAQHLNNHFGFKGKNSNTEIKSAYRDFPSVDSSYNHLITFLKSRKHFNHLFDKYDRYDFRNWVRGVQRGGYARSKLWGSKVIALIKKYDLHQYDNRPEDYVEPAEQKPIYKPANQLSRTYTVKRGDNLSTIAKRYKTTVKAIKAKNDLKSDALSLGKKLKI